jgi:predicted neuraminidase
MKKNCFLVKADEGKQTNGQVHLDLNAETSRDEVALLKEDRKQNYHHTEEGHEINALIQVSLNAL